MSEPVTFRSANTNDIAVIQDLATRIWREHYPGIITHGQIDYMLERMYAAEVMRDEMTGQGYRYTVVDAAGSAAGFIAFRYDAAERSVTISKLYLLPSLHGRGIGQLMLAYVRTEALRLGASALSLFVNKRNTRAIAAYERFGFVRAEEVVKEIGGGFVMDDYRMELSL